MEKLDKNKSKLEFLIQINLISKEFPLLHKFLKHYNLFVAKCHVVQNMLSYNT